MLVLRINNLKDLDKHLKEFTDGVTETIKHLINEEHTPKRNLRLSAIGKPARQLWYDKHTEHEDKKLSPSFRIKFFYGHLLEEVLILFSRLAGHTVTGQQKEVEIEGVKGHQDCFIDDVLVDCKSASGKSFLKFKENRLSTDDPFGYIPQISAYAEGNGVDESAFLAIDKQNGHICLDVYDFTEELTTKEKEVKEIISMVKGDIPEERISPVAQSKTSPNMKLSMQCSYCDFKSKCWPKLRTFIYSTGPLFLTHVEKVPNVPEIKNVNT